MKHLPLRDCGYAIVFVLLLLTLYGGAYLAMMERFELGSRNAVGYRFAEEWSEVFFAPAHGLDRVLRPDLWQDEMDPGLGRRWRTVLREVEKAIEPVEWVETP